MSNVAARPDTAAHSSAPSGRRTADALGTARPGRAVRLELIRRILVGGPATLVASLIVGLFVAWGLREHVDHNWLVPWVLLHGAVTVARIGIALRIRGQMKTRDLLRVSRVFVLGALASGLIWASLVAFYDPAQPAFVQLLLLIVLVGMPVASLAENAKYLPVYLAFNAPILLALVGIAALALPDLRGSFAAIAIAYALLTLAAARQYNRNLIESIKQGLRNESLVRELERSNSALQELAYVDPLTKLSNRRMFDRLASAELDRLNTGSADGFVLMLIDLDLFKQVNDRFGHDTGDQLLALVAERLRRATRDDDLVGLNHSATARLGGDEFVAIFEHPTELPAVRRTAARIAETLSVEVELPRLAMRPSVSIGVALAPAHGVDLATLLINADHAMYQAKMVPGSSFVIFEASEIESVENPAADENADGSGTPPAPSTLGA